ncbi:MAG: single-stranded DNA-binding protein [Dehalococcoidales bacterium]|jgi:single-strand DNA-binding protein|nr:single-stranded DNA-binding protein [Dehalococcoidales bacterium]
MVSVNRIIIIGNLGSEPEMRFTPNGKPVTSFSVATNRRYTTSDGERREETEWFTVVTWGKLAEQCNQYLNKGRLVYVEGRLRSHTWEGQDGQKRSRNEIVADRVSFIDRQATTQYHEDKPADNGMDDIEPDDIPF